MNYKLYIHNRKDYEIGGMTINSKDDSFVFEKDNVSSVIPIEKFSKITSKMDGSVTYKKNKFKIPKKLQSESDILVYLENPKLKTVSKPISSIHYNAEEHVQLIQHLRNNKDILSIAVYNGEISLEISNYSLKQEIMEHYNNFSIKNDFTIIQEILSFYLSETSNSVFIYDIEELKKVIKFDSSYDSRFYEFKNHFSFDDYVTYCESDSLGFLNLRASQLSYFYSSWGYKIEIDGKDEDLDELSEKLNSFKKDLESKADFEKIGNILFYPKERLYESKYNDATKEYIDTLDFEEINDKKFIYWCLYSSISESNFKIATYIMNKSKGKYFSKVFDMNGNILLLSLRKNDVEFLMFITDFYNDNFTRYIDDTINSGTAIQAYLVISRSIDYYENICNETELANKLKKLI